MGVAVGVRVRVFRGVGVRLGCGVRQHGVGVVVGVLVGVGDGFHELRGVAVWVGVGV